MTETYQMPEHGWTCFHCGLTFEQPNAARDHFGYDIEAMPACLFDGKHVRSELRRFRVIEHKLRNVLGRLYSLREMLDGAPPTGRRRYESARTRPLRRAPSNAINGLPVPEWELKGEPAPWPFNIGRQR